MLCLAGQHRWWYQRRCFSRSREIYQSHLTFSAGPNQALCYSRVIGLSSWVSFRVHAFLLAQKLPNRKTTCCITLSLIKKHCSIGRILTQQQKQPQVRIWDTLVSVMTSHISPRHLTLFMSLSICLEEVKRRQKTQNLRAGIWCILTCHGKCIIPCSHFASGLRLWRTVLVLLTARPCIALLHFLVEEKRSAGINNLSVGNSIHQRSVFRVFFSSHFLAFMQGAQTSTGWKNEPTETSCSSVRSAISCTCREKMPGTSWGGPGSPGGGAAESSPWRPPNPPWTWAEGTCSGWPCLCWGIDQMSSGCPFQPQPFFDSLA